MRRPCILYLSIRLHAFPLHASLRGVSAIGPRPARCVLITAARVYISRRMTDFRRVHTLPKHGSQTIGETNKHAGENPAGISRNSRELEPLKIIIVDIYGATEISSIKLRLLSFRRHDDFLTIYIYIQRTQLFFRATYEKFENGEKSLTDKRDRASKTVSGVTYANRESAA